MLLLQPNVQAHPHLTQAAWSGCARRAGSGVGCSDLLDCICAPQRSTFGQQRPLIKMSVVLSYFEFFADTYHNRTKFRAHPGIESCHDDVAYKRVFHKSLETCAARCPEFL